MTPERNTILGRALVRRLDSHHVKRCLARYLPALSQCTGPQAEIVECWKAAEKRGTYVKGSYIISNPGEYWVSRAWGGGPCGVATSSSHQGQAVVDGPLRKHALSSQSDTTPFPATPLCSEPHPTKGRGLPGLV